MAAALLFAVPSRAQAPGPLDLGGLRIPAPTGYVNDFANVLDPQSEAAIQGIVDDVRAKSGGAEIVVVTLPSLEGRPIFEVATEIARGWRIGSRGEIGDSLRNVGALVLLSLGDRRVRIHVSEGANNFITAAESGRIQDQYMLPAFRRGDYAAGLRLGVQALAGDFARHFGFQLDPSAAPVPPPVSERQPRPTTRSRGFPPGLLFILFMVLYFLINRRGGGGRGGRRRRRGWGGPIIIPFPMGGGWGGGGFGGGGGGGGFGGFGGGGGWSGGGSERGW